MYHWHTIQCLSLARTYATAHNQATRVVQTTSVIGELIKAFLNLAQERIYMWDHILPIPDPLLGSNWFSFAARNRQSRKGVKWLDRDPQKEYNGLVIWYNPNVREWHATLDLEGV